MGSAYVIIRRHTLTANFLILDFFSLYLLQYLLNFVCRMLVDVSICTVLYNLAFLCVSVIVSVYYKEKFVSIMKSKEYTYL